MVWTAKLAYVVGLIVTDGSISNDGRHIVLVSKDKEQILTFVRILQLKSKVGLKKSGFKPNSSSYFVQFSDVRLYRFLVAIGIMSNKTNILSRILVPDEYFADFLRGHLDGDGYTISYWDMRWKSSFMIYLGFTSASLGHLQWMQKTIQRLYGVSGKINFAGNSTYRLIFAKNESLILIGKMYYRAKLPCLERKRLKINTALGIIGKKPGC